MSAEANPAVVEVLRFEELRLGSLASRSSAVVRWSEGSEGEGLRWYSDEILSPVGLRRAAVKGAEHGAFRVMSMFTTSHPSTRLMSGQPDIE